MKRLVFVVFLSVSVCFQYVFSMESVSTRDEHLSCFDSEVDKDILNFLELFKDVVRLRFNLPRASKKVVARNKKKSNKNEIPLFIGYQFSNQNEKFSELYDKLTQLIRPLKKFSRIAASHNVELAEGVVFDQKTIVMLDDAYDSARKDYEKDTRQDSWNRGLNALNELEFMLQSWHSNILYAHEEVRSEIEDIIYSVGNIKEFTGEFLQE